MNNKIINIQLSQSVGLFGLLLVLAFFGLLLVLAFFISIASAVPSGPNGLTLRSNETLAANQTGWMVNISGGYIGYINISATVVNPRWKAFVGNVTGKFTLSDSSSNVIYDWTLASVNGRVFATRNSSAITWTNISCANTSELELENYYMNHTSSSDNISKTFNSSTHSAFTIGSIAIGANKCPSLATYISSTAQTSFFQEIALTDSNTTNTGKIVYSTKLENQHTGFDSNPYDFQMIVPENGVTGFSGVTPYYLYVELS